MNPYSDTSKLLDAHGGIIMFYNTENLFDTHDNPHTDDDDFLPSAPKKWTNKRYYRKIINISRVISYAGNKKPLMVGLAEIENKWIVKDLINTTYLREGNYDFIHTDSPDERGIDVAFLYRKAYFSPTHTEAMRIELPGKEKDYTRDILYVKGVLKNGDEWNIFVNHWPSRGASWQQSEYKRMHVAKRLRKKIDALLAENKESKILIMGDFNDYPKNKSISQTLNTTDDEDFKANELFNMAMELEKKGKGSYCYKGDWGMLDQMITSKGLFRNNAGYGVQKNKMYIFTENWLLFRNKKLGDQPDKTYGGTKYHGGYSDHLPVYVILD